jgi:hypothetical protein
MKLYELTNNVNSNKVNIIIYTCSSWIFTSTSRYNYLQTRGVKYNQTDSTLLLQLFGFRSGGYLK